MLKDWKQRLTHGWGFMRLFRLGLAILVLIEAWKNTEILFGVLGSILLFQSLMDVGCCGSGGCDITQVKTKEKSGSIDSKEVTFEEIK
jgi:hypothetical protein